VTSSELPQHSIASVDPELERTLQELFANKTTPEDLLALLAARLPPAARYAHALLAALDAFDAQLFEQLVAPLVERRFKDVPSFDLIVADHAQRLDARRYRLDSHYAKGCLLRIGKASDSPNLEEAKAFVRRVVTESVEAGPNGDFERLRLLAAIEPRAALEVFEREFAAADANFDLPRCKILCDAIALRPLLDLGLDVAALLGALSEREAYLASRSRFATEFYRSGRYYVRKGFHEDMVAFLEQGPWALHLHAKGGMGKTAFLQWLIARHCVSWQARIPVARVDLDQIRSEQRRPERLAFLFAEQLDAQLPRVNGSYGPFTSLLASYKSETPPAFLDAFLSVLSDLSIEQRLVLLFDTMEECGTDDLKIAPLFHRLKQLCVERPLFRVLTAGRYHLAHSAPRVNEQLDAAASYELKPFSPEESAAYLRERAGLAEPAIVWAIIERAKEGLPFKLSLLAEIVQEEQLSVADIAKLESVDLEYLIARIVLRLPEQLRWALRYGVIPRVLTREVFERVIVPHVLRASESGAELDDPTLEMPKRYDGNVVFSRMAEQEAGLWEELLSYESATSWVSRGDKDSLLLHPDVRAPMQRMLWQQQVTAQIHAELADFYAEKADQAKGKDTDAWASANVESFYHRFRSERGVAETGASFVETTREIADRAPEQSHALLDVVKAPHDRDFEPERGTSGTPWLTPEQWGTALVWTAEAAKALLGSKPAQDTAAWFVNVAAAARQHTRDREAQKRLQLVAEEALREVVSDPDLANITTEISSFVSSTLKELASVASTRASTTRQSVEHEYRSLKLKQPARQSPAERDEWLLALDGFFQEVLTPIRVEPRVTRLIASDYVSELIQEGQLDRALRAWYSWRDAYYEQAMAPEAWLAAAEAAARSHEAVPEAPDSVSKELYQARADLMRDVLSDGWQYQEQNHFTDTIAVATEAELLARRCEDQKLDYLLGRLKQRESTRDRAMLLVNVAIWGARMSLYLVGDVKEAASYLRERRETEFDQLQEAVAARDLLDIEIALRGQRDPSLVLQQLKARANNRRPRELLAEAVGTSLVHRQPIVLPSRRVAPPAFENRLLRVWNGSIFGAQEQSALRQSPKFSRSGGRAKELEASHNLASVVEAIGLYRDLGDLANANRLERPDVLRSPQAQQRVTIARSSGPLHEQLASEQLGSSLAVQGLADGSLMPALALEVLQGKELPERVIFDIAPELSSLPCELLPRNGFPVAARSPCARTRHVSRTQRETTATRIRSVRLFADEKDDALISRVTAQFYAQNGLDPEQYDLRRLEAGASQDITHLIVRLAARGSVVTLLGLEWTAISLARMLGDARILVLQAATDRGSSSIARSLLLRNAFAAELFELSRLQALVAVGPFELQDTVAPSIARVASYLARGEMLPENVCQNLCLWGPEPEVATPGSLAASAVFCDEPGHPLGNVSSHP
jgi:hypothetical protein